MSQVRHPLLSGLVRWTGLTTGERVPTSGVESGWDPYLALASIAEPLIEDPRFDAALVAQVRHHPVTLAPIQGGPVRAAALEAVMLDRGGFVLRLAPLRGHRPLDLAGEVIVSWAHRGDHYAGRGRVEARPSPRTYVDLPHAGWRFAGRAGLYSDAPALLALWKRAVADDAHPQTTAYAPRVRAWLDAMAAGVTPVHLRFEALGLECTARLVHEGLPATPDTARGPHEPLAPLRLRPVDLGDWANGGRGLTGPVTVTGLAEGMLMTCRTCVGGLGVVDGALWLLGPQGIAASALRAT